MHPILWLILTSLLAPPLIAQFAEGSWKTDTTKRRIELSELIKGGPPKDGIASIDRPRFIPADKVDWLSGTEFVISITIEHQTRAYPLRILMWHELVNDQIGDTPTLVSYCPLCNSAIVFDRRLDGRVLEFGVSGMLRNSDMVMYDRQSDSLWQQITGEGIVGTYSGMNLRLLPSQMITFAEFTRTYPNGAVLSKETGFARDYGRNPYQGYEFGSGPIMPVRQVRKTALRPMERLVVLRDGKGYRAYPMKLLAKRRVVETELNGERLVILYSPDGASPVDNRDMTKSRSVGSIGVFRTEIEGDRLKFQESKGLIEDRETGSRWNVSGLAVDGERKGQRLQPVAHGVYFTFAWLAFEPDTRIIGDTP